MDTEKTFGGKTPAELQSEQCHAYPETEQRLEGLEHRVRLLEITLAELIAPTTGKPTETSS